MKLLILLLSMSALVHAEDKKCNPVGIKVDGNSVHYAQKAKDEAEKIYRNATSLNSSAEKAMKFQEAFLKYREAYEIASKDLSELGQDVLKNQCADTPMIFGAPKPGAGTQ